MPEISRFFGIVVAMYYNDHAPPHLHAKYGGHKIKIDVANGSVLEGSFPNRALALLNEWRVLHIAELQADWVLLMARHPLNKIEPLE